ncbi:MAG TPA: putative lipid II flippase FtsW [Candidatus Kerfeldbacteria bacterium]|nr:putative lipid II flippase FtsW [Candidatus Kerfeldbacteria bacterium]
MMSASSVVSFERFGSSTYLIGHQLLYGLLFGLIGMFVAIRVEYQRWKKWAFPGLLLTILLLVAVFIPGIGYGFGGARRWISLGSTTFQPTELLKLTFVMYLATWVEKRGSAIKDAAYGFAPFVASLGIVAVLVMLQPDLGTMTVVALISIIIYFVAGAPLKHLLWMMGGGSILTFLVIQMSDYRSARFTVFLNPNLDPQGIGYHINQALLAIGSGGVLGLGLGHSRQKYNFLPEVTGDSIFAIIAEELGFILSVGLIALFLALMFRGFSIAQHAPDTFGKLLATGITSWFVLQAFVNIGAMVGILPLTGIPLPFVSYGSSALAVSLLAAGILINISRQTKT